MEPKVALEFFEAHLPAYIKDKVDLSTLIPQKESYIDDHLRMQLVDVLFSVDFKDGQGYFYVLMEHSSKPDRLLP